MFFSPSSFHSPQSPPVCPREKPVSLSDVTDHRDMLTEFLLFVAWCAGCCREPWPWGQKTRAGPRLSPWQSALGQVRPRLWNAGGLREKQSGGGEVGDVESLGCCGTSGIHTFPRLIFLKRVLIMGAQMSCFARSIYAISHTVTSQYILIG